MKLTGYFYAFFILLTASAQQNRMWIPSEAQTAYEKMVQNGARFKSSDLYHPEKPSFNDAIVQFNGGCTAEIISPQSLLLTNHHCGYGAIQSHSTLTHNYVEDGFWAYSKSEELPNPGMYVTFVRRIINLTDRVLKGVTEDMSPKERQSRIDKNIAKIKKEIKIKPWQSLEIKPFLYGNKYYGFVKENYKDIRLVGAPPSSIGKFGADSDNWMWPRHSGDFSLFRIYADKNNRPAEYSPDNVPYKPEKYLKVSMEGVREGDLIVIYGFPGRTRQYLPSFAIAHITQNVNPVNIEIRQRALDIMDKFMRTNDTLKLKYTSIYARVSNYWKKWKGENQGIAKSKAISKKQKAEALFLQSASEKGFGKEAREVLDKMRKIYQDLKDPEIAKDILVETMYINNDWIRRGFILDALVRQADTKFKENKKRYLNRLTGEFRKTDNRVSKELFIEMMKYYKENMPPAFRNNRIVQMNFDEMAEEIEKKSVLADSIKMKKLFDLDYEEFVKSLKNDSGYNLAHSLITDYYNNILPAYQQTGAGLNELMRKYIKMLQEAGLYQEMVPDANGTLRLSFGKVYGYEPRDGMYYEPISTLDGVIEKYIPGDYEFDLPAKLLEIYKNKDFGNYRTNGSVPVNFLGTAHTTGGNSGSPALNAEGELVGLNFDRVWEGTMSDLFYDPKICRNIMVDLRYVMFIIDKMGNAQNILREIQSSQ